MNILLYFLTGLVSLTSEGQTYRIHDAISVSKIIYIINKNYFKMWGFELGTVVSNFKLVRSCLCVYKNSHRFFLVRIAVVARYFFFQNRNVYTYVFLLNVNVLNIL